MPAEIGSTLVWTVYTRDTAGVLADATSPALSVVLPDGWVKTSSAHPTVAAITKTATARTIAFSILGRRADPKMVLIAAFTGTTRLALRA